MKFRNQVEREFWQEVYLKTLAAEFADKSVEALRARWYPVGPPEEQAGQTLIDPDRQGK